MDIDTIKMHFSVIQDTRQSAKVTQGEVIAIDGKTLRGSYNRDDRLSTLHMVTAYASVNHLILGQVKTDNKSNEITVIPVLIRMLSLRCSGHYRCNGLPNSDP